MNYLAPAYVLPYVLIGNVAILTAVSFGLHRAVQPAGWPAQDRRRAFRSVTTLLTAWFLAALFLAWSGFYRGTPSRIPTIGIGVLGPILGGIVLFRSWPLLRRAVEAVPQSWLVRVQFYRVLGLIFVVLYWGGHLPGDFALPAGIGDFIVGLLAPAVSLAYSRGGRQAAVLVRAWNWFGIADLIVAVTAGLLTSPSPIQRLALDAPNRLISAFPLAMVPVFLVPLSVLLHLASLRNLRAAEGAGQLR